MVINEPIIGPHFESYDNAQETCPLGLDLLDGTDGRTSGGIARFVK